MKVCYDLMATSCPGVPQETPELITAGKGIRVDQVWVSIFVGEHWR